MRLISYISIFNRYTIEQRVLFHPCVKYQPFISSLCFSSYLSSLSSGAVCCSCSVRGSLGCSEISKSAHWLRSNAPSDRSSCPVRAAQGTDPKRGLGSAPRPSSSSSPPTISADWTWPPRLEIAQRLMSFKWGHCDPQGLDFSPLTTQYALGPDM